MGFKCNFVTWTENSLLFGSDQPVVEEIFSSMNLKAFEKAVEHVTGLAGTNFDAATRSSRESRHSGMRFQFKCPQGLRRGVS